MMVGTGSRPANLSGRFGVAGVLACLFMWHLRSCLLSAVWSHLVQENVSDICV